MCHCFSYYTLSVGVRLVSDLTLAFVFGFGFGFVFVFVFGFGFGFGFGFVFVFGLGLGLGLGFERVSVLVEAVGVVLLQQRSRLAERGRWGAAGAAALLELVPEPRERRVHVGVREHQLVAHLWDEG